MILHGKSDEEYCVEISEDVETQEEDLTSTYNYEILTFEVKEDLKDNREFFNC